MNTILADWTWESIGSVEKLEKKVNYGDKNPCDKKITTS